AEIGELELALGAADDAGVSARHALLEETDLGLGASADDRLVAVDLEAPPHGSGRRRRGDHQPGSDGLRLRGGDGMEGGGVVAHCAASLARERSVTLGGAAGQERPRVRAGLTRRWRKSSTAWFTSSGRSSSAVWLPPRTRNSSADGISRAIRRDSQVGVKR